MNNTVFIILCLLLNAELIYCQTVKGRVFDEDNNPISNANIHIKSTKIGVISDIHGKFLLKSSKIENDTELIVSFLGYKSQTIKITENLDIDNLIIVLERDAISAKEVVVSAKKMDYYESILIPVRTTTIDNVEIKKIPSISTAGLLTNISGVNVSSDFGIFSSSTTVALRGIGGNSQTGTLVVVDGTPVNKSDAGSVNWNIIDKDNIEQIEIIKGPGSVLFGSNAMGGIINIITKQPKEKISVNSSLSYGTFNTYDGRLNLSGRSNNGIFYWKYFTNYKASDGYINTPDEIILENDSVIVPVFLNEFFTGAMTGYNINEKNSVELSFSYFNDVRGRGIKIYEHEGSKVERNTYQSFAKYKGRLNKVNVYSNIFVLSEDYFRLNEYYGDGEYNLFEVSSIRNDYGSKVWCEFKIDGKNEIILGSDLKTGSVNGADIYYTSTDIIRNKGQMDIYSLFLQNKYLTANKKLSFVSGLRFDYANFYNSGFSIEQPSYSVEYMVDYQFEDLDPVYWTSLSPKLALEYQVSSIFKNYISISKGFRAPLLDDLCRNEERRLGYRIANPNIKPEHIYNFEYGFDLFLNKKIKLESSFFYALGNDFMYLLATGDSVNLGYTIAPIYVISNISSVNIYGLEADLIYNLNKNFSAYINYSYNIGKISKIDQNALSTNSLTGKYLADIPAHKYSLGFVFQNKIVNISASGKYNGVRWIKDDNSIDDIYLFSDKYPSYYIFNARLWKTYKSFELGLDIDNISNQIYINSRGYKSHGRFVILRLTYNFNK